MRDILDAPVEELRGVSDIGSVTPVALQIIKAAATLYLQKSVKVIDIVGNDTSQAFDVEVK